MDLRPARDLRRESRAHPHSLSILLTTTRHQTALLGSFNQMYRPMVHLYQLLSTSTHLRFLHPLPLMHIPPLRHLLFMNLVPGLRLLLDREPQLPADIAASARFV
jgi:hypothetical protein